MTLDMMNVSTTEQVYNFIQAHVQQWGHAPSQREIAKACFLAQSSVRHQLKKLESQGRIELKHRTARGVRLASQSPGY